MMWIKILEVWLLSFSLLFILTSQKLLSLLLQFSTVKQEESPDFGEEFEDEFVTTCHEISCIRHEQIEIRTLKMLLEWVLFILQ